MPRSSKPDQESKQKKAEYQRLLSDIERCRRDLRRARDAMAKFLAHENTRKITLERLPEGR